MANKKPEADAPAIHCAHCHAIAAAKAAAKSAGVATRAAQRAETRAEAAAATILAARPKSDAIRWRGAILWGAGIAAALAMSANLVLAAEVETADGAPVYHVAEIETADGRIIHGVMIDESACLDFTRAIGPYVARANCIAFTGAPRADYHFIPPAP